MLRISLPKLVGSGYLPRFTILHYFQLGCLERTRGLSENGMNEPNGSAEKSGPSRGLASDAFKPALQVRFPLASLLANTENPFTPPPKWCRMPKLVTVSGPVTRSLKGHSGCSRGREQEVWQRWPSRQLTQKLGASWR